jgi:CBS domain containing-hemolysin-like protein
VLIETFNQVIGRNRARNEARQPFRERTADAILRLMGGRGETSAAQSDISTVDPAAPEQAFRAEERQMISGVLALADRSIRRIMTPRSDISWVDSGARAEEVQRLMLQTPHSVFPVCNGSLDRVLGVMRAKDLLTVLDEGRDLAQAAAAHPPILVPEQMDVIKLLGVLRQARGTLVLVVDEFGIVQGLVTPHDVLEAIAGEFPDSDETPDIVPDGDGWLVKGGTDLFEVERVIGDLALEGREDEYHTLAGLLLAQHEQFPTVGERFGFGEFGLTVVEVGQHRIERVRVARAPQPAAEV